MAAQNISYSELEDKEEEKKSTYFFAVSKANKILLVNYWMEGNYG